MPNNPPQDTEARRRRYIQQRRTTRIVAQHQICFTPEQCDSVVSCAESHATRHGWSQRRHSAYPTRDVPVGSLSETARDKVLRLVGANVIPKLCLVSGLLPEDLYLVDLFIVRYEPGPHAGLDFHTDGCLVSFNVLLSNETAFDGGGTLFDGDEAALSAKQGTLTVHDAKLRHAGAPVTRGRRDVLVGFVETVRADPALHKRVGAAGPLPRPWAA